MKQTAIQAFAFVFLYLLFTPLTHAQNWVLEKTVDGIEVFTRSVPGDPILELKIEFTVETKIAPVISILDDIDNYCNWVYKSAKYEEVESYGPGAGIYYGVVDFPWPLDDRDFIIESSTHQDPVTKVVTMESKNVDYEYQSAKDCYVRVPKHYNRWQVTPIDATHLKMTYFLKSDPGGSIPTWMVNLAIDKGAIETVKNLKELISAAEQNTRIAYIQEK